MIDRKQLQDFGVSKLKNSDIVSLVALGQRTLAVHGSANIKMLAEKLNVPLMTEHANRFTVVERLLQPLDREEKPTKEPMCRTSVARTIATQIAARTGIIKKDPDAERRTIMPWLRSFCLNLINTKQAAPAEIASILDIPLQTVVNFKSADEYLTRPFSEEENFIMQAWNSAPRAARKNLERFWAFLGQKYPKAEISYDFVRQTTINLGLRQPYKKQKNEGVVPMREFSPLSYWAADGKQICVTVNGQSYVWHWYAFGCTGTSFFVGANVSEAEDSRAFLEALKDAHKKVDTFPIGILIDNRLARERVYDLSKDDKPDLPAEVLVFCKEHGIIIVHSWPGNPKSNIIENHFSVFSQHVQSIDIAGESPKELSASIARAVTETFMKVRNHTPRKRFRNATPHSLALGKKADESDRSAIAKLATRMSRNKKSLSERWSVLLPETIACFTSLLDDKTPTKIMAKQLLRYSTREIIEAQAAFHAQKSRHPEKTYGEDYFFGILRNKREQRAKMVYADTFRAGIFLKSKLPHQNLGIPELRAEILRFLSELEDEESPFHQRYHLQALMFFLVSVSTKLSLPKLWQEIIDGMVYANIVSERWFSSVVEFAYEHIGDLLYENSYRPLSAHNYRSAPIAKDRMGAAKF